MDFLYFESLRWAFFIMIICLGFLAIIMILIFALIIIGNIAIKICDIVRYLTSTPSQRKKYKKEQAKRNKVVKSKSRKHSEPQLTELDIIGNWSVMSKKEREDFDNRTLAAFESGYSAGLEDYRKGRPCKKYKGNNSYEDGYFHGYYWS